MLVYKYIYKIKTGGFKIILRSRNKQDFIQRTLKFYAKIEKDKILNSMMVVVVYKTKIELSFKRVHSNGYKNNYS